MGGIRFLFVSTVHSDFLAGNECFSTILIVIFTDFYSNLPHLFNLMVHQMKPSSNANRTPIRRKRLSEPRPHPSHCLNKRFWDEVRAGRLQINGKTGKTQLQSSASCQKEEKVKKNDTQINEAVASTSPTSTSIPQQTISQTTTQNSAETTVSNRVPAAITTPSTSAAFFQMTPGFLPMPHPPGFAQIQPANFWPYMAAAPFQMTPGFLPMPHPPYMMPFQQQPIGFRPDQQPQSLNNQPRPTTPRPTSNQAPQQQTETRPTNMFPPNVQFIPVPIPIPIPLSTDFVLKHFGKKD
ncbi:hypothetical protein M3Y97_00687700 [Aphelenchoides bicaudatus]|nr:hypothetical protein M3Y97_00687700 [Aphelenchoides bicaudatus]